MKRTDSVLRRGRGCRTDLILSPLTVWLALLCFLFGSFASFATPLLAADREDEETVYHYRLKLPQSRVAVGGDAGGEHSAPHFSDAQIAQRQQAVADFLKTRSGPLSTQDVVQIYHLAGHFSVVHGMLGGQISTTQSQQIGRLRQQIHEQALELMCRRLVESGQATRLGVNDFGSGADMSKVNAMTDIDFTAYSDNAGIDGARLVDLYQRAFSEVTGGLGARLNPGDCDIVAHRFEATIPDWRRSRAVSSYETTLRTGTALLRNNPEAYALEGAFRAQVMRRSTDPSAQTFSWLSLDDAAQIQRETVNAGTVREFFYTPETAKRYSFGAAVGNWHFYNAHESTVARAKYLLRSIDDGLTPYLPKGAKTSDLSELSAPERRRVVAQLFQQNPDFENFWAAIETAIRIREIKKHNGNPEDPNLAHDVYEPMIDKLRADLPGSAEINNQDLLRLAEDAYQHSCRQIMMENIVRTAGDRFNDWLAAGEAAEMTGPAGERIQLDSAARKRLRFAAFFEIRDALRALSPDLVQRIIAQNPRLESDIRILQQLNESERNSLVGPDSLPPEISLRQRILQLEQADYHFRQLGDGPFGQLVSSTARRWAQGQEVENYLQRELPLVLLSKVPGPRGTQAAYMMRQLQEHTNRTNDGLLSSTMMMGLSGTNSLVNVCQVYLEEGDMNLQVGKALAWEIMGYVPVVGPAIDVAYSDTKGKINLVFMQIIPGYAPTFLVLNLAKGVATLGAAVIFEPLKRDKIMLAYQGYLEEDAGVLLPGFKEPVVGPRPGLLHFVDPEQSLSLDQRRRQFFRFFLPRVEAATSKHSTAIREVESKQWMQDFATQLGKELKKYVDSWWDGTGEFSAFDTLTVKRMIDEYNEESFKAQLQLKLAKDFWDGYALLAAEKVDTQKRLGQEYREKLQPLVARQQQLDVQAASPEWREQYQQAATYQQVKVLQDMPTVPPALLIETFPGLKMVDGNAEISRVNFRAIISASEQDHPYPWKIEWSQTEGRHPRVTAIARDGTGAVIARASLALTIEKEAEPQMEEGAVPSFIKNSLPPVAEEKPKPVEVEKVPDCKDLRERFTQQGKRQAEQAARMNCEKRSYSGCATDYIGVHYSCLPKYVFKKEYCEMPGYTGCVTGPYEGYLACIDGCNSAFRNSSSKQRRSEANSCGKTCMEAMEGEQEICLENARRGLLPQVAPEPEENLPPFIARSGPKSLMPDHQSVETNESGADEIKAVATETDSLTIGDVSLERITNPESITIIRRVDGEDRIISGPAAVDQLVKEGYLQRIDKIGLVATERFERFMVEGDKGKRGISSAELQKLKGSLSSADAKYSLRLNGKRCWPRNYINPPPEAWKHYAECDKLAKSLGLK